MNIKKGFTLIELIIVMAIVTIILGVVVTIFSTSTNIFNKVDLNSELQLEAQKFELAFMDIALESKGIDTVNSVLIVDGTGQESVSKLILMDGIDTTIRHVYEISGNSLIYNKQKDNGLGVFITTKTNTISKYVSSFHITFSNPKYMKFEVTFKMERGKNKDELTLNNQVVFRNYN